MIVPARTVREAHTLLVGIGTGLEKGDPMAGRAFPSFTRGEALLRELRADHGASTFIDIYYRRATKHVLGQLIGDLPSIFCFRDHELHSGRVKERVPFRNVFFRYFRDVALGL